jgi:putative transcriptional regulator
MSWNSAAFSRFPDKITASHTRRYRSKLSNMTLPQKTKRKKRSETYLKGQLLVAMPLMTDRRFARSVIYMCAHSDDGAMGLIINHRADHINFPDLLERLGIVPRNAEDGISNDILERQVHLGGPVETGRGFVLPTAPFSRSAMPAGRPVNSKARSRPTAG